MENITSVKLLITLSILISIWIIRKNREKFLEIKFLYIVIGGAEVLQITLRNIFRRLGPLTTNLTGNIQYTFPSNVYAGYIFGGVWLTINIVLLEVYRILSKIQL